MHRIRFIRNIPINTTRNKAGILIQTQSIEYDWCLNVWLESSYWNYITKKLKSNAVFTVCKLIWNILNIAVFYLIQYPLQKSGSRRRFDNTIVNRGGWNLTLRPKR